MNTKLPSKINDYVRYASISQQHYKGGLYSDSALNCRKACEAICKVIIYNTYSEKLADTKVEYCNLKELIILIIKDGLAERKVINRLESLQIIGNKSAHDNFITKEEATYSLQALNLLTDWLFKEYLKIAVPNSLQIDKSEPSVIIEPTIIEKIIVQEKISQETEDQLINRFQNIIEEKNKINDSKTKTDDDTISEIKKALNETNQKLNTLNASKDKAEPKTTIVAPIKRTSYKKWLWVSIVSLISIGIFFIYHRQKNVIELATPITKHPDSIYIAINEFKILQDNPNINFKIESILQSYISAISSKYNLPFKIVRTHFKQSDFINDTSIVNTAGRIGYDLIYLGNVYETALSDSNIIELNGSLCTYEGRINRSKKIKFKNLTDSTLIKELNDQANLAPFYVTQHTPFVKQGLTILAHLTYYSTENYMCGLTTQLNTNLNLKNYQACINNINQLAMTQPLTAYYTGFKAGMFLQLGMFDSSEVYSKKAILLDNTYQHAMLNLAETYKAQHKDALAEVMLLKIVRLQPYNEIVNVDLALLYHFTPNPKLAKYYALMTHRINENNIDANFVLAEYYAYDEVKNDSAEYYYNLVLSTDSNFVAGLNSFGNYCLKYHPEKKGVAKYLLTKAKQSSVIEQQSNDFGLGITAYNEKNYQECIRYLEKVCEQGVYNNDVSKCLTLSYYALNNLPKALFYAKKGIQFDSTNNANLYNYATLLSLVEPTNTKVNYYFKKAIKQDPNNSQTLIEYATYLGKQEKYQEVLTIALPLYKTHRTDVGLNQLIANAYLGLENYHPALNYLEYLHIAQPTNADTKRQLAWVILNVFKGDKVQFARGASLIKDAVEINPNNIEAHIIRAHYFIVLGSVKVNEQAQFMNCKKIAKQEYLLAKKINPKLFDENIEKFIK